MMMNERRLYSIIALMSIALIGIIWIQVSLLRRSLAASEKNFEAGVNDALHAVVSQLQARRMRTVIYEVRREEVESLSLDQMMGPLPYTIQTEEIRELLIEDGQPLMFQGEEMIVTDEREDTTGTVVWLSGEASGLQEDRSIRIQIDGDPSHVRLMKSTLERLRQPEAQLPLDLGIITPLIHQSLEDQGIDLEFELQLATPEEVRDSGNQDAPAWQASSWHHVTLFPQQVGEKGAPRLAIQFPRQSMYLWQSIWREAVGSLLFSGIILLCFGLTVGTIFRQKRLSEMKNDFINNMTHELKTPIATIGLATEALEQQGKHLQAEWLARYTGMIRDENQRMHRQVERVLQAAQFDRQGLTLQQEPLTLSPMLRAAADQLRLAVESRGGQLTLEVPQELPLVPGDAEHLPQVFANLLDNANKYSPQAPDIRVSARQQEGMVRVSVQDHGRGIPRKELERIFTRFYRVSTGDLHEVKGFGLGLSYVKEIVEAHGGHLQVESQPGSGSTFHVFLPITNEHQTA